MIWLTDKFREAEISMAGKICKSKLIPWYDKSILVSSLTLSLVRHFDIQKVNLLFDFFEEGENQVWQRALIAPPTEPPLSASTGHCASIPPGGGDRLVGSSHGRS